MTTRRDVLAFGTCVLVTPLASFAQQQRSKVARIVVLESGTDNAAWREALIAGLRELGLVEGKNIVIDYRFAEGKYERLAGLVAELEQMKVDVIVAASSIAVRAAQRATTSIPIVMVRAGDPVGHGFVTSLARPGRNITGLSSFNVDVSSKYLELLRDAIPKLSRVAVLMNPANPNHVNSLKRIEATGQANSVTVSPARVRVPIEVDAAYAAIRHERAEALIVLGDPFFRSQSRRITELAAQNRLPTMFTNRERAESGGLMSYGQNTAHDYYRAATYIDKILKGAKPGDLPVEQPTKLELVINLKTAKAIGLTIPQQLLLQADKVIE